MIILKGKVRSGIGDFGKWIAKYQDIYFSRTELSLFPGTLNLELDEPRSPGPKAPGTSDIRKL